MTFDEALVVMRPWHCSERRMAEEPCVSCAPYFAALAAIRAEHDAHLAELAELRASPVGVVSEGAGDVECKGAQPPGGTMEAQDKQRRLTALYTRDDHGVRWNVEIKEIQGCRSWGRSLEAARRYIREALELFAEDEGLDAATVPIDEEFASVPREDVDAYKEARLFAEAAVARASEASRRAVRTLRARGLSTRDVGAMLGISQARVAQLEATDVDAGAD